MTPDTSRIEAPSRSLRFCLAVLCAASALSIAFAAHAEVPRDPCPDLEGEATPAEHAQCWFDRHRTGADTCRRTERGADTCIEQSAAWCNNDDGNAGNDADLSDQQIANVCLLALVGAHRYDAAHTATTYVRDVAPEARECFAAFTSPLRVHVVTDPPGAVIAVDGRHYGPAPVELSLAQPWWDHRVTATFEEGARVERGPDELADILDARSCSASDLVIESAAGGRTAGHAVGGARAETSGGISVPGLALVIGGGAAAVVGGVLMVLAESSASDVRGSMPGTAWSSVSGDWDSAGTTRIAGAATLGVGVIAGVIGVIVLAGGSSSESPERARGRARHRRAALAPRPGGAALRWEF